MISRLDEKQARISRHVLGLSSVGWEKNTSDLGTKLLQLRPQKTTDFCRLCSKNVFQESVPCGLLGPGLSSFYYAKSQTTEGGALKSHCAVDEVTLRD